MEDCYDLHLGQFSMRLCPEDNRAKGRTLHRGSCARSFVRNLAFPLAEALPKQPTERNIMIQCRQVTSVLFQKAVGESNLAGLAAALFRRQGSR